MATDGAPFEFFFSNKWNLGATFVSVEFEFTLVEEPKATRVAKI